MNYSTMKRSAHTDLHELPNKLLDASFSSLTISLLFHNLLCLAKHWFMPLFVCFLSSLHLVRECTNKFLIWTWESRIMLYFSIMSGAMEEVQFLATFIFVSIIHCHGWTDSSGQCLSNIFFWSSHLWLQFSLSSTSQNWQYFPIRQTHCGTTFTRHGPAILALYSIVYWWWWQ